MPVNQERGNALCAACQLTSTIPDLSVPGNRERWAKLEDAKRRLLYQLDLLKLPYLQTNPPLSFDFKGDVFPPERVWRRGEPRERVYTGHVNGKITININEADDVEREKIRVDMQEPQRTLIGHFRHEIGHYYWLLLVQGQSEDSFETLFGNPYEPDYGHALEAYYAQGPSDNWPDRYVSAYASSHPWEDFAETFGIYLDMIAITDTAAEFGLKSSAFDSTTPFHDLVTAYQQIGIAVNELNRALGIFDLVPEVIVPAVQEKLEYVHDLVRGKTPARMPQSR